MSANSPETERHRNPTHFGGEGLYDSTGVEEADSLKVQLGDHLDRETRRSLLEEPSVPRRSFDYARRNPIPVLIGVGAVAGLLLALTRKSLRR